MPGHHTGQRVVILKERAETPVGRHPAYVESDEEPAGKPQRPGTAT
jgi:hypothetical protein